ncbi:MAG: glycolate oxidase subunit GlcF [Sulfuriflexus sp.]|nr:glycolate oxidase subunit GlcF [Sulfuriflexus sp.]
MQTIIHKSLKKHPLIEEVDSILRSCVHCGFCNATCPTYQLLGDELDGPRGRIYLMKQMFETGENSSQTLKHLDRCLTCRNCETTCPSGVQYGRLLTIGREIAEKNSPRLAFAALLRWSLRQVIPHRKRIGLVVKLATKLRRILPASVQRQLPTSKNNDAILDRHQRMVILPAGCAQDAFAPDINADCRIILDKLGVTAVEIDADSCCGAMSEHMAKSAEAHHFIKKNINAWWPSIEAGAEAIISTASACGIMIKDYGKLLENDPDYAEKAARVSELCADVSEFLSNEDLSSLGDKKTARISFHAPCTLQHGQGITGSVESLLSQVGYDIIEYNDAHLCCGSAGAYSILQPNISKKLLLNKLDNLLSEQPDIIATANIGCLLHMRSGTETPVVHWLQLLNPSKDSKHV